MASGRNGSMSGISTRRTACDKCRFSKARCLRERPDQTRCDRCSRTNSDCVTSPIFRLRSWQPPTADGDLADVFDSSPQPNKRRRQSNPGEGIARSDWQRHSMASLSTPTLSACGPSLYEARVDEPMDTTFGNVDNILDMNLSEQFFATMHMLSVPPLTDGCTASPYIRSSEVVGGGDGDNTGMIPANTEQTPMQRLSKLDHENITLRARLGEGPQKPTMKELILAGHMSSSVVHQILNKTTEFIRVLELLADPGLPLLDASLASAGNISRHISQDRRPSSGSSPFSLDDDSFAGSPANHIDSTDPSSSACNQSTHADLDTPSLLLVLITYMNLVQLYLIAFVHINRGLKELSQSDNPHLGPISGLAFSSFPMQSGNLQTMILIQIVINLFEKTDDLLDLPEKFRMSRRRRGAKQGLLSQAPGFSELARSLLEREENTNADKERTEDGKGGIRALRKHIAEMKQLMRENIAP
ncbi:hypothetical protein B0T17DRAFT_124603 [Bombardia bombarda]|uniref:Zn(2)-C6 fungal-type domain-containing protein n=1 Tax=Bombardia bombarda TaxID=252184 RepID=A0AA39TGJ5_9PEZI|nr:hypothetical protein B0T17DRAFT_124603 [Bombardia bombarda]